MYDQNKMEEKNTCKETDGKGKTNRRRGKKSSNTQKGKYPGVKVVANNGNDPAWYKTLPELTAAAANFPFSRPLGVQVSLNCTADNASTLMEQYEGKGLNSGIAASTIPGFMMLHWEPTVGISVDGNSPLNVTAREIYSFVRHANSGAANYDATDLMIYLLALDSIYSAYTAAARVYGLANMYSSENRYMPKYLVEALGWNFEDVLANQAQFNWALNNFCYKISSLAVPNFMSYYLRHIWMNTGVYTDKPGAKAQIYGYVQDSYYMYQTHYSSGNLGGLTRIRVASDMTVMGWMQAMNNLINPILASEDFGIMSGDILKAFGQGNLFTVAPVPRDYVVVPTHNPEVLTQIQNAVPIGGIPTGIVKVMDDSTVYTGDIYQPVNDDTAEGFLYSYPLFNVAGVDTTKGVDYVGVSCIDRLITSDEGIPSQDFVMVSTRLTNKCDHIAEDDNHINYGIIKDTDQISTEVLSYIDMVYIDARGETAHSAIDGSGIHVSVVGEDTDYVTIVSATTVLTKFDWCPTFPVSVKTVNGTNFYGYWQDTNNYTVMTSEDLTRLHEAAIMSMFWVPQIGSLTRSPYKK